MLLPEKMDSNPLFCPILFSKPNMGIDHIDNVSDSKNSLKSFFSFFLYAGCVPDRTQATKIIVHSKLESPKI